ncbi:MAG TPA: hypothetical protein VF939_25830 [Puia sp.]
MAELKVIRFRLYKIITDEFAILEEKFDSSLGADMKINLGFNFIEDKKLVAVQVKCLFYQQAKLFLAIAVSCLFIIDPEDWDIMYETKNKTLTLPLSPALRLSSLTVGTTRGVLHAKTEHLPVNIVIIPPVNLNGIIKEKVIIVDNEQFNELPTK